MKLDITLKGVESCGPDPEEVFREKLLAALADLQGTLVRIAVALETGPRIPASMTLRVSAPTQET